MESDQVRFDLGQRLLQAFQGTTRPKYFHNSEICFLSPFAVFSVLVFTLLSEFVEVIAGWSEAAAASVLSGSLSQ